MLEGRLLDAEAECSKVAGANAALVQRVVALDEERNGLQFELDRMNETVVKLESTILSRDSSAGDVQEESLGSNQEEESFEQWVGERDELLLQMARVNGELDNSRNEVTLLQERLEEASSECRVRSCRIEELEDEVEELGGLEEELLDCKDQLADALDLCEKYKTELSFAWQQLSAVRAELIQLQTISQVMPESMTAFDSARVNTITHNSRINDLAFITSNTESKKTNTSADHSKEEFELRRRVHELESRLNESRVTSEMFEQQRDKVQLKSADIADLEAQILERDRKMWALQQELQSTTAALDLERQRRAIIEDALNQHQESLLGKEKAFQESSYLQSDHEKEIKQMESKLTQNEEEMSQLKEFLQTARSQNLELSAKLTQLEHEQQSLKYQMETLNIELSGLRSERDRLQKLYEDQCLKTHDLLTAQDLLIQQRDKDQRNYVELQGSLHQKVDEYNLQQIFIESLKQQYEEEKQAHQVNLRLLREKIEAAALEHQRRIAEVSMTFEQQSQEMQQLHQEELSTWQAHLVRSLVFDITLIEGER